MAKKKPSEAPASAASGPPAALADAPPTDEGTPSKASAFTAEAPSPASTAAMAAEALEALEHARMRLADADDALARAKEEYRQKVQGRKQSIAGVHKAVKESRDRMIALAHERNALAGLVAESELGIDRLAAKAKV